MSANGRALLSHLSHTLALPDTRSHFIAWAAIALIVWQIGGGAASIIAAILWLYLYPRPTAYVVYLLSRGRVSAEEIGLTHIHALEIVVSQAWRLRVNTISCGCAGRSSGAGRFRAYVNVGDVELKRLARDVADEARHSPPFTAETSPSPLQLLQTRFGQAVVQHVLPALNLEVDSVRVEIQQPPSPSSPPGSPGERVGSGAATVPGVTADATLAQMPSSAALSVLLQNFSLAFQKHSVSMQAGGCDLEWAGVACIKLSLPVTSFALRHRWNRLSRRNRRASHYNDNAQALLQTGSRVPAHPRRATDRVRRHLVDVFNWLVVDRIVRLSEVETDIQFRGSISVGGSLMAPLPRRVLPSAPRGTRGASLLDRFATWASPNESMHDADTSRPPVIWRHALTMPSLVAAIRADCPELGGAVPRARRRAAPFAGQDIVTMSSPDVPIRPPSSDMSFLKASLHEFALEHELQVSSDGVNMSEARLNTAGCKARSADVMYTSLAEPTASRPAAHGGNHTINASTSGWDLHVARSKDCLIAEVDASCTIDSVRSVVALEALHDLGDMLGRFRAARASDDIREPERRIRALRIRPRLRVNDALLSLQSTCGDALCEVETWMTTALIGDNPASRIDFVPSDPICGMIPVSVAGIIIDATSGGALTSGSHRRTMAWTSSPSNISNERRPLLCAQTCRLQVLLHDHSSASCHGGVESVQVEVADEILQPVQHSIEEILRLARARVANQHRAADIAHDALTRVWAAKLSLSQACCRMRAVPVPAEITLPAPPVASTCGLHGLRAGYDHLSEHGMSPSLTTQGTDAIPILLVYSFDGAHVNASFPGPDPGFAFNVTEARLQMLTSAVAGAEAQTVAEVFGFHATLSTLGNAAPRDAELHTMISRVKVAWCPRSHVLLVRAMQQAATRLQRRVAAAGTVAVAPDSRGGLSPSSVHVSCAEIEVAAILSHRSALTASVFEVRVGSVKPRLTAGTDGPLHETAASLSHARVHLQGFDSPLVSVDNVHIKIGSAITPTVADRSASAKKLVIRLSGHRFYMLAASNCVLGDALYDMKEAQKWARRALAVAAAAEQPEPSDIRQHADVIVDFALDLTSPMMEWEEIDGLRVAAASVIGEMTGEAARNAADICGKALDAMALAGGGSVVGPPSLAILATDRLAVGVIYDSKLHNAAALEAAISKLDPEYHAVHATQAGIQACPCNTARLHGVRDVYGAQLTLAATALTFCAREAQSQPVAGASSAARVVLACTEPIFSAQSMKLHGFCCLADPLPAAAFVTQDTVVLCGCATVSPEYAPPIRACRLQPVPDQSRASCREVADGALPPIKLRVYRAPTPTKLFHDLSLQVDEARIDYGPSREADLSVFATAAARMVPTTSRHPWVLQARPSTLLWHDTLPVRCPGLATAPRAPPLKWWDRLRFYTHGHLRAVINDMLVRVSAPVPLRFEGVAAEHQFPCPSPDGRVGFELRGHTLSLSTRRGSVDLLARNFTVRAIQRYRPARFAWVQHWAELYRLDMCPTRDSRGCMDRASPNFPLVTFPWCSARCVLDWVGHDIISTHYAHLHSVLVDAASAVRRLYPTNATLQDPLLPARSRGCNVTLSAMASPFVGQFTSMEVVAPVVAAAQNICWAGYASSPAPGPVHGLLPSAGSLPPLPSATEPPGVAFAMNWSAFPTIARTYASVLDSIPAPAITSVELGLDHVAVQPVETPTSLSSAIVTLLMDLQCVSSAWSTRFAAAPPASPAPGCRSACTLAWWPHHGAARGVLGAAHRLRVSWRSIRRPQLIAAEQLPAISGFELTMDGAAFAFARFMPSCELRSTAPADPPHPGLTKDSAAVCDEATGESLHLPHPLVPLPATHSLFTFTRLGYGTGAVSVAMRNRRRTWAGDGLRPMAPLSVFESEGNIPLCEGLATTAVRPCRGVSDDSVRARPPASSDFGIAGTDAWPDAAEVPNALGREPRALEFWGLRLKWSTSSRAALFQLLEEVNDVLEVRAQCDLKAFASWRPTAAEHAVVDFLATHAALSLLPWTSAMHVIAPLSEPHRLLSVPWILLAGVHDHVRAELLAPSARSPGGTTDALALDRIRRVLFGGRHVLPPRPAVRVPSDATPGNGLVVSMRIHFFGVQMALIDAVTGFSVVLASPCTRYILARATILPLQMESLTENKQMLRRRFLVESQKLEGFLGSQLVTSSEMIEWPLDFYPLQTHFTALHAADAAAGSAATSATQRPMTRVISDAELRWVSSISSMKLPQEHATAAIVDRSHNTFALPAICVTATSREFAAVAGTIRRVLIAQSPADSPVQVQQRKRTLQRVWLPAPWSCAHEAAFQGAACWDAGVLVDAIGTAGVYFALNGVHMQKGSAVLLEPEPLPGMRVSATQRALPLQDVVTAMAYGGIVPRAGDAEPTQLTGTVVHVAARSASDPVAAGSRRRFGREERSERGLRVLLEARVQAQLEAEPKTSHTAKLVSAVLPAEMSSAAALDSAVASSLAPASAALLGGDAPGNARGVDASVKTSPVLRVPTALLSALKWWAPADVMPVVPRVRIAEYGIGRFCIVMCRPDGKQSHARIPVVEMMLTLLRGEHEFFPDQSSRFELDLGAGRMVELDPTFVDGHPAIAGGSVFAERPVFARRVMLAVEILGRDLSPLDRLLHVVAVARPPVHPVKPGDLAEASKVVQLMHALRMDTDAAVLAPIVVWDHLEVSILPGAEHVIAIDAAKESLDFVGPFFFGREEEEALPSPPPSTQPLARRQSRDPSRRGSTRGFGSPTPAGNSAREAATSPRRADLDRGGGHSPASALPAPHAAHAAPLMSRWRLDTAGAAETAAEMETDTDTSFEDDHGASTPEAVDDTPGVASLATLHGPPSQTLGILPTIEVPLPGKAGFLPRFLRNARRALRAGPRMFPDRRAQGPGVGSEQTSSQGARDDAPHADVRAVVNLPAEAASTPRAACAHVLVPYTRLSARPTRCAACNEAITGFRTKLFKCVQCGVRLHPGTCVQMMVSSGPPHRLRPSEESADLLSPDALRSPKSPVVPAAAARSAARNDDAVRLESPGRDKETQGSTEDGGLGPLFAGKGNSNINRAAATSPKPSSAQNAEGRGESTASNRADPPASGRIRSIGEYRYFRYVRISHISLSLKITGYLGVNIDGVELGLRPIVIHNSLLTWTQLFSRLRRHLRGAVWSIVPRVLGSAVGARLGAGFEGVASLALRRRRRAGAGAAAQLSESADAEGTLSDDSGDDEDALAAANGGRTADSGTRAEVLPNVKLVSAALPPPESFSWPTSMASIMFMDALVEPTSSQMPYHDPRGMSSTKSFADLLQAGGASGQRGEPSMDLPQSVRHFVRTRSPVLLAAHIAASEPTSGAEPVDDEAAGVADTTREGMSGLRVGVPALDTEAELATSEESSDLDDESLDAESSMSGAHGTGMFSPPSSQVGLGLMGLQPHASPLTKAWRAVTPKASGNARRGMPALSISGETRSAESAGIVSAVRRRFLPGVHRRTGTLDVDEAAHAPASTSRPPRAPASTSQSSLHHARAVSAFVAPLAAMLTPTSGPIQGLHRVHVPSLDTPNASAPAAAHATPSPVSSATPTERRRLLEISRFFSRKSRASSGDTARAAPAAAGPLSPSRGQYVNVDSGSESAMENPAGGLRADHAMRPAPDDDDAASVVFADAGSVVLGGNDLDDRASPHTDDDGTESQSGASASGLDSDLRD